MKPRPLNGAACENGYKVKYYCRVLSLLFPLLCLGTSIVRVSLEDTVAQAEWIVEGDVVRNWSGWDSGHRFIWTHTEIAVRNRWKGAIARAVTVSEPGGAADGVQMDVADMVRYVPGEHVIVFLYRTPIGFVRTVGLSQGKLLVDDRGLVHAARSGASIVGRAGARTGTSITDLESASLIDAHRRIADMMRSKAVRE